MSQGLAGDDKEAERGIVLRAIDKLDRLGLEGVRALLGEGRKDESGDFTKGAGLSDEQTQSVMAFVYSNEILEERLRDASTEWNPRIAGQIGFTIEEPQSLDVNTARIWNEQMLTHLLSLVQNSKMGIEGVQELAIISKLLAAQGYGPDRIVIDPSVVRGLGYYTGPVYEAELTFDVQNEKGQTVQFGSVAGGGRYDDLVKRFTGQEVPATGISIGVDRLLAALRATNRIGTTEQGPVVVTVMDRDRMADYQQMVAELRSAGIRAEVYLGNPKNFGNQLKYADKRESPRGDHRRQDDENEQRRGADQGPDTWARKIAESGHP